jgi:hypothetical protein
MPTHGVPLRAAFDSRDLEPLLGLLDERVIWRGLPSDELDHDEDDAHAHSEHDHGEHDPLPLCTTADWGSCAAAADRLAQSGSVRLPDG